MSIATAWSASCCSGVNCHQNRSKLSGLRPSSTYRTRLRSRSETTVRYCCRVAIAFSSTPRGAITSCVRRVTSRRPGRTLMPQPCAHFSHRSLAAAVIEQARSPSSAQRWNNGVNRLWRSAQGMAICLMPGAGPWIRGTSASMTVVNWPGSKLSVYFQNMTYIMFFIAPLVYCRHR